MILALIVSFSICYMIIEISKKLALYQPNREEIEKKIKVPTLGGLAIIGTLNLYFTQNWTLVLLTNAYALLGLIDDILKLKKGKHTGLKIRYRLMLEIIFALIFVHYTIGKTPERNSIPSLSTFFNSTTLNYLWGILTIVGSANSYNLTDGMDSLAGVLGIFVLLFIVFTSKSSIAIVLILALIGFLYWNRPQAKIYMGDTGALGVGAFIGGIYYQTQQEQWLILTGAIFIIETISVILQIISYKFYRKRIFLMTPIHHHFEKKYTKKQVLIGFHLSGFLLLLIAVGVKCFLS